MNVGGHQIAQFVVIAAQESAEDVVKNNQSTSTEVAWSVAVKLSLFAD